MGLSFSPGSEAQLERPSPPEQRRGHVDYIVSNVFDDMESSIDTIIEDLKNAGKAKPGDAIVVGTGTIVGQKGATNLMRVHYA